VEIKPIVSSLWFNKTGPVLICLQIAFTLALVVNAIFLIDVRLEKMNQPLGIDTENIFSLSSMLVTPVEDHQAFMKRDMEAIRAIPGVVDATPVLTVLHSGSARADTYRGVPELNDDMERIANVNFVDEHGLDALGIELIAGRNFRADEIVYLEPGERAYTKLRNLIISESMGRALFPEGEILGRTVYYGEENLHLPVIGVVSDVATAWMASDSEYARGTKYNFMLQPFVERKTGRGNSYMIRTEPGMLERTMPEVEDKLFSLYGDRLITRVRTQTDTIERSYATDRAITQILSIVSGLMVLITALGIVGLASFSVNQRTRQIGTRRALGAKKRDILRYFLVENILLTSMGVSLGSILVYGFHFYLFSIMPIPKMTPEFLPMGIITLYVLGLLAVMGPALRAASTPPGVATRSA
jgi:putative ABC transport system permease protein